MQQVMQRLCQSPLKHPLAITSYWFLLQIHTKLPAAVFHRSMAEFQNVLCAFPPPRAVVMA